MSGIRDAVKAAGGRLYKPADADYAAIDLPNARKLKKAAIPRDLIDYGCLINMPVAKSHGGATLSISMKNWMGSVSDRGFWHRTDLHQCIADIATVMRPKFTLVDASRILTTHGPGGPGDLYFRNTIVAGTQIATVDAHALTLATWSGKTYKPAEIPHIRMAAEHGLGEIDPAKFRVARKIV